MNAIIHSCFYFLNRIMWLSQHCKRSGSVFFIKRFHCAIWLIATFPNGPKKNVMWSVGSRVTHNYGPQLLFWDVTSQSRFVARYIQQGEVFSSHTDILWNLQFLLCLQLWSRCPRHFVDVCSKWICSSVCQHFNEKNLIVNIEIATTKLPSSFDAMFFIYEEVNWGC